MHERQFHGDVERLRSPRRLEMLEVERVVDISLNNIKAKHVLDIGVGSGVFAEAFTARGLEVTGIDINPQMIDIVQSLLPNGHFQVAVAESLPFPEKTFDVVFLGHILHEAQNAFTMLQEARRVANVRVAVLEWPYQQEEIGPPLAHRMKPDEITVLAQEIGFRQYEEIRLTHMGLYLMTK